MAALKAMVAIADSTLENLAGKLTLTQFRALRTVVARTPVTMGAVAQELAINPSSVTRACDRLTAEGLLERAPNPLNKREILLAPTARGRRIVERIDHDRREALAVIMREMSAESRAGTASAFAQFAKVADHLA